MKALSFSTFGGPDVLEYQDRPDPVPAPGSAVVRLHAMGLNFADVYRRRGSYHLAGEPPYIAGYEGAGVVESVHPDDAGREGVPRPGDRVGFADSPHANAEQALVSFERLIPLPDDIPCEAAAAVLLQGLTAQYLVRDSFPLQPGQHVLVHAAAGGVGLLLVQMARAVGASVAGLVSSSQKAETALAAGADPVHVYGAGEWVEAARAGTPGGRGFDVVYDAVGSTLLESLRAARTRGAVVFFGMAGGDPPPIDPRLLMDESKTVTGGDLWNVLTTAEERRARAAELFSWMRSSRLRVRIDGRFALAEGRLAHERLESRQAMGKVLLVP